MDAHELFSVCVPRFFSLEVFSLKIYLILYFNLTRTIELLSDILRNHAVTIGATINSDIVLKVDEHMYQLSEKGYSSQLFHRM